jgi:hypothetical protein
MYSKFVKTVVKSPEETGCHGRRQTAASAVPAFAPAASASASGSASAALPSVASPPSLTRQRSAAAMSLQLTQHTDRIVKEVCVCCAV